MRRSSLAILGTAALAGSIACAPAFGSPTGQSLGLRAAQDAQSPIQEVQYYWDGYDYCWYDFGWRGPGWYVCEYGPYVTGYWWGGPLGWHGWRVGRGERFDRREGRTFGQGPGRGFSGPSTEGRAFTNGPGRSEGTQGMSRGPGPAPVPGFSGPATVGRGGGPGPGGGGGGPSRAGGPGGGGGGPSPAGVSGRR
jgi:hypothetical protein